MKKLTLVGFLATMLVASMASAHESDGGGDCRDEHCRVKTKEVCFNLVCLYDDKYDFVDSLTGELLANEDESALSDAANEELSKKYRSCRVAATFKKDVTKDGGEVADDSGYKNNPEFEVTCDGKQLYNNSGRRFTGLLGTRIQGQTGPFPAITLPRGALHKGADRTSGEHVSFSHLELDTGHGVIKKKGTCYIWSGAP